MDDLIKRADAIERIANDNVVGGMKRINEYRDSTEHNDYLDGISTAIATVDDLPSADVVSREEHFEVLANKITDMEERGFVQVVRCKDCKWWGGNKNTEHNNHICNRALNQNVDYWTRADDFCSYGERAEQKMEGNK